MLDIKSPTIIYRPMRPSDLEVLEKMHAAFFPVRYEKQFFLNIVTGKGIMSWAAVDISRPDGQSDELVGFVTTCVITAKDSEIEDLLRYDISRKDQTLVYILTLGVVEHYRNLGVATSLVREVINYASSITKCTAVYLHVISYNHSAIHFYKKMLFKLVRKLPRFYDINGQHYDSYLFVYFVNGAQSPCSPLTLKVPQETVETSDTTTHKKGLKPIPILIVQSVVPRQIVAAVAAYIRGIYRSLRTKIWKNEKQLPRWSRCRETSSLLVTHNLRIVGSDSTRRQV